MHSSYSNKAVSMKAVMMMSVVKTIFLLCLSDAFLNHLVQHLFSCPVIIHWLAPITHFHLSSLCIQPSSSPSCLLSVYNIHDWPSVMSSSIWTHWRWRYICQKAANTLRSVRNSAITKKRITVMKIISSFVTCSWNKFWCTVYPLSRSIRILSSV